MKTPDVTPAQYGAGGTFLLVAGGCLQQGVTGVDLLAYLVSAAFVTGALILGDGMIRNGRARNAQEVYDASYALKRG